MEFEKTHQPFSPQSETIDLDWYRKQLSISELVKKDLKEQTERELVEDNGDAVEM